LVGVQFDDQGRQREAESSDEGVGGRVHFHVERVEVAVEKTEKQFRD
jgi:hypothetical protein